MLSHLASSQFKPMAKIIHLWGIKRISMWLCQLMHFFHIIIGVGKSSDPFAVISSEQAIYITAIIMPLKRAYFELWHLMLENCYIVALLF